MTRYFLFLAGFDGEVEQVGVATSDDLHHWQITPQPAIPLGAAGTWDAVQTSNPSVLYDGGRFRMWYQGVDERNTYRIGYAESNDGWTWHKRPDIPLFAPERLATLDPIPRREGYHQPLVLKESERYLMYFNDHRNGLGHIRVATSEDGYTWQLAPDDCLTPETTWESWGLHYPWVIRDKQHPYVMWYTAQDFKSHWHLGRAVSADGLTWQRQPAHQPVIGLETTRRFSKGNFWMPRHLLKWYPNYRHPKIRYGKLKQFTEPTNPIGKWMLRFYDSVVFPFRAQRFMSFNNGSVVQQPDGSYLMVFQSRDENGTLAIGTCTSSDGIHWGDARTCILRETIQREGYTWCSVFDADPHLLVMDGGA